MAGERIAGWEGICARIHDLWVERLDDYDRATRGDLHDVGPLIRDAFTLDDREAEQALARWEAEHRPRSLLIPYRGIAQPAGDVRGDRLWRPVWASPEASCITGTTLDINGRARMH